MKDQIEKIKQEFFDVIGRVRDAQSLRDLEVRFLGRKSQLTNVLRNLKNLSIDERRTVGSFANAVRQEMEQALKQSRQRLAASRSRTPRLDITWPGQHAPVGHLHPITQFLRKVEDIFVSMGFEILDGPEIETEQYNFDLLNIPKDHPARDKWDTFYVESPKSKREKLLLRTHTSPVQLRAMEKRKPPVRLIVPGRAFRHEATDASHETTFYQCEGLVIDEGVSVTNLIATLQLFLRSIFVEQVKTRVRPEYYPFVEPGMDIDMSCLICGGKGCSVCKHRGWLEMMGSGMVHPQVLKNMRVDPKKYRGFAFGMGIDRLMMLYYGINNIRLSYAGDLRFLEQF